jgi:hypothetical protein
MSPGWSIKPKPMPFAMFGNPQTRRRKLSCRAQENSSKIVLQGRPACSIAYGYFCTARKSDVNGYEAVNSPEFRGLQLLLAILVNPPL